MLKLKESAIEYRIVFTFDGKFRCTDATAENVEMKAECLLEIGVENLEIKIVKRETISFDLEKFKKEREYYEKNDDKQEEQIKLDEQVLLLFLIGEGLNTERYSYDVTGDSLTAIKKLVNQGVRTFGKDAKARNKTFRISIVIIHEDDTKTYMDLEDYKKLVRVKKMNIKEFDEAMKEEYK